LGDATSARVLTLSGVATSTVNLLGVISDGAVAGGGITISGGNFMFTQANSYTGLTSLLGGTVITNISGAFGTSNIIMNGGLIAATNGAQTVANAITLTGNGGVGAGSAITLTGTITVFGDNDAPTIVGTATVNAGTVIESGHFDDGSLSNGTPVATGQVVASDPDHGATLTYSSANTSSYGTFSLNSSTGAWSYALNDGLTATQQLQEGQSVTQNFTVQVSDTLGGVATQTVTVTIQGTNDRPVGVSDTNAADIVRESGPGAAGDLVASGNVLTNDFDVDANSSFSVQGFAAFQPMAVGGGTGSGAGVTSGTFTGQQQIVELRPHAYHFAQ